MGDGSISWRIDIRIAEPSKIASVAELKSQVWESASPERWPWQFQDHPLRPARRASNFKVAETDGCIEGGVGWMPTQLLVDGKKCESAFTCDGFVDSDLPRAGVRKAMIDAVLSGYPASLWMKTAVTLPLDPAARCKPWFGPGPFARPRASPCAEVRSSARGLTGSARRSTRPLAFGP